MLFTEQHASPASSLAVQHLAGTLMSHTVDFLLHSTSRADICVSQCYSFKCSNKPALSLGGLQQHPFTSHWPLHWLLLFSMGLLQSEIHTKGKTPPCHILFFFPKEEKGRHNLALPFIASILCSLHHFCSLLGKIQVVKPHLTLSNPARQVEMSWEG